MTSEYKKWWDFFRTGNNQYESIIRWFSEHKADLPSSITSMVSVGAGCGDVDSAIITKSLTGVKSYIGVEPNKENREILTATMTTQCPSVQIIPEPFIAWHGPSEPVDLVLVVNVFYQYPDCVGAVQELYSWVRPGGVLIIAHSDHQMYAGVAKEAGLDGDYSLSNLREDVMQASLSHFKEYNMPYTVDMGSTFNEEMVRFYYKPMVTLPSSEANVQKCVDIFKKRFERSDRHQTYNNGIILLKRLHSII